MDTVFESDTWGGPRWIGSWTRFSVSTPSREFRLEGLDITAVVGFERGYTVDRTQSCDHMGQDFQILR